ncbi:DUF481 domain-containing protein [Candidatus Nitrospira bockiana]
MNIVYAVLILLLSCFDSRAVWAQAPPDLVTLKGGSLLYGEVMEMSNGELKIKTRFGAGDQVTVKWDEVEKLSIGRPIPMHLKDGTVLVGTIQEGPPGSLVFQAEPLQGTLTVPLGSVAALNPLVQPAVVYTGTLSIGFSQTTGNSHLRNGSLLGDFSGRSESLRLTILGRYIYGDDQGRLIARNSRGTVKLDFFITKRLYWFASAYFEQDTFQDLKLRTSLASGPGYQILDTGDLKSPLLTDMTLYAEAGLAYFNEDFKIAPDKSSTRVRWSVKFNWPFLDERITLFHFHEAYPSIQNFKDFYITLDSGVRLKIFEGFVSVLQLTTRYNNNPPPGINSTDNLYLMTFGYTFDTARKR